MIYIQNAETCVCGLKYVTCCDRLSLFSSEYICTRRWETEILQYIEIRIVVTFKYVEREPHVWTVIHSTTMRGKVLPVNWGSGDKLTKLKGYCIWARSPQIFQKSRSHFNKPGLQNGDKEEVSHLGPQNIRRHRTKI